MSHYYDGTRLLSLSDLNGNKPEIYLCTSNRSGGKTTFFSRLIVNRFKDDGSKFMLIYRFNYEIEDVADKFFKDIGGLFFPNMTMTSRRRAQGIYHELYLNDISCGYAVSLNSADQLKKYSHLFSDTSRMMFDEFQSETNHYCSEEVRKLISIHTSVARGQGQFVRYVPLYMVSNPVTLLNPYYAEMGISTRLRADTKFLRGDGWVLEQGFVENASKAQMASGFNRAFAKNDYVSYSAQATYLNDNSAFVERPEGSSRYLMTLRYEGHNYGVRLFDNGIAYVEDRADDTFPVKITVTTSDHQINYVMLKRNDAWLASLRTIFEQGGFRFKNLQCKDATLKALSYYT